MKILIGLLAAVTVVWADSAAKRLDQSAALFREIMDVPENSIPQDLLQKAHCIVIVPASRRRPSVSAANTAGVLFPAAKRAAVGARQALFEWRVAASASRSGCLLPMS